MKHYTAVQSVTSQAKRLNSSTSPTGQRRVSIAIVPLIMKQEPSWLPTQYIMLVISRPTHTHMSTRALERWTQVVCGMLRKTLRKRRGGGGIIACVWCNTSDFAVCWSKKQVIQGFVWPHRETLQFKDAFKDGYVQVLFLLSDRCWKDETCRKLWGHIEMCLPAIWEVHQRQNNCSIFREKQCTETLCTDTFFNKLKRCFSQC